MLFEMTLLKFDSTDLILASTFLGPFCFSLFIIIIVFICMSMFISIINQIKDKNKEEMIKFMLRKFQRWIGNE